MYNNNKDFSRLRKCHLVANALKQVLVVGHQDHATLELPEDQHHHQHLLLNADQDHHRIIE